MATKQYQINGTLIHTKTKQPLPKLRVEIWDKDLIFDDRLGSTVTDEEGTFSFTFDRSYFQECFENQWPDLYFKIFDGDRLVADTSDSVLWNTRKRKSLTIKVDLPLKEPDVKEESKFSREDLLALDELSALTPEAIKQQNADLYQRLLGKALADLRRTLTEHFADSSEDLQKHVQGIDLTPLAQEQQDIKNYLQTLLQQDDLSEAIIHEASMQLRSLVVPETLAALLQPDVLIRNNPLFQTELQQAATHRLGEFTQLGNDIIQHLLEKSVYPQDIDQEQLDVLVREGVLQNEEARELGLNASLYQWAEGNFGVMAAAKQKVSSPEGGGMQSLRDLAALKRYDWVKLLEEADITPSGEFTRETYGAFLGKQIELLYPSEVFKAQLQPVQMVALERSLQSIQPLFANNEQLFGGIPFSSLDLTGIKAENRVAAEAAYSEVNRVANLNPGMDIVDLLFKEELSSQEKVVELSRRVQLMPSFYRLNPSVAFLNLDYLPGSKDRNNLVFGDMNADEKEMVLETLMANQRINQLTQDAEDTLLLMESGYYTAFQIASDNSEIIAASTGLSKNKANTIFGEAQRHMGQLSSAFGAAVDVIYGGLGKTHVDNTSPDISNVLRRLPDYEALFGNLDYCHCPHCESIISPVAYFVDLMEFIEKHVLNKHFKAAGGKDNPLNLYNRRRDLWESLPLTCESTYKLVPYLEIINEILENYIFCPPTRDDDCKEGLADRKVVERKVYKNLYGSDDASAKDLQLHSFQQPFLLPLEQLNIYLSHFSITRTEVASAVLRHTADSEEIIPQAVLNMSPREYWLIKTPIDVADVTDRNFLKRLYGGSLPDDGQDVRKLLGPMQIGRHELGELIERRFVTSKSTVIITITGEAKDSIQINIERINGLTLPALDRMHRFVRLWKKLPWSLSELDLIVMYLYQDESVTQGASVNNDRLPLKQIALLKTLQERFNISPEGLCPLFGILPFHAVAEDRLPLFDRLFNLPTFVKQLEWDPEMVEQVEWVPYLLGEEKERKREIKFLHPAEQTTGESPKSSTILPRLLAGLGVDDETLQQLIGHLKKALKADDTGVLLDLKNLSLLYRHVRLAALLKLSIAELFQLIVLSAINADGAIANLSGLEKLLNFHDWWRSTDYSLDDLAVVTGATPRRPDTYPQATELLEELIQNVQANRSLVFADTVFAFFDGVTEAQSKAIIKDNIKENEKGNPIAFANAELNAYRISDSVSIEIPPEAIEAIEPKLKALLSNYSNPRRPTFNDTVFTKVDGISKDQSKAIITANLPGIFEKVDASIPPELTEYRISSDIDDINAKAVMLIIPPEVIEALKVSVYALLATYSQPGAAPVPDTVFMQIKGITSAQSKEIFRANFNKPEIDKTLFWLVPEFDLSTPISIPEGIPLLPETAQSHLTQVHVSEVIPNLLAAQLALPVEKLKALVRLAGFELSDKTWASKFATALQGKTTPISDRWFLQELEAFLDHVQRLKVLFQDAAFTPAALRFIAEQAGGAKQIFPVAGFQVLTIEGVQALSTYHSFIKRKDVQLDALHRSLSAFDSDASQWPGDEEKSLDDLAQVLAAERGLVATLNHVLTLPGGDPTENRALDALAKLQDCVELAQYLGVGGGVLGQLVATKYDELFQASDTIFSFFRTQYEEEEEWQEQIAPFEDKIRERKRDALTDYIIHTLKPNIVDLQPGENLTTHHLYYWFLIDTELEGCARTSRVVAGISSLQLYVQRCLMNLEQSADGKIKVLPEDIPAEQWVWRKNYRVWEANRKVFLYPENYIEPDLRDNKTPLFEALESELLQQEINEQTVLDAYTKYIHGFEEIARLKIAGAFHDRERDKDILHLFGVTSSDPVTYYYRTIENIYLSQQSGKGIVWNPWRKIDVQIPVKKVSPIVFKGRLYVFWVEITTRPHTDVEGGSSRFKGYKHNMAAKFAKLRLDGMWTTPQVLLLGDQAVINDALLGVKNPERIIELENKIKEDEKTITKAENNFRDLIKRVEKYNDMNPDELSQFKEEIEEFDVTERGEIQNLINKLSNKWSLSGRYPQRTSAILSAIIKAKLDILSNNLLLQDKRISLNRLLTPRYGTRGHVEPQDNYTLTGYQWDQVYPGKSGSTLRLVGNNFELNSDIDLYQLKTKADHGALEYSAIEDQFRIVPILTVIYNTIQFRYGGFSLQFLDATGYARAVKFLDSVYGYYGPDPYMLATINTNKTFDVSIVNGSKASAFIDIDGDILYLQWTYLGAKLYKLIRFGTTLSKKMARKLFEAGVDALLDIKTQEDYLKESNLPLTPESKYVVKEEEGKYTNEGKLDFTGSLGVYYREIFFHIPLLIANHLNSQQKFAEAQRWYHYIFDPTSSEIPNLSGITGDEARKKKENDRNWQYLEFRNHTLKSWREQLGDPDAIEAYKNNPFNPHAIARLRLGAYQKTIVMKYIDNLLDWGDHLFAQDTMESINEATLLYVMAADILGERPAELGDCQDKPSNKRTYSKLKGQIKGRRVRRFQGSVELVLPRAKETGLDHATIDIPGPVYVGAAAHTAKEKVIRGGPFPGNDSSSESTHIPGKHVELIVSMATSFLGQAQVFCIPPNQDLLGYWDRVEDRLHKIRNCMNISGVRRQLSLFSPEIDPRLLVRAKAAGLSLQDVLNSTSGNLPPYRFSFLIVKAKEYVGALQGFGGALLAALEKKDAEELAHLRTTHQQNILKLTSRLRDQEIEAAEAALVALNRRKITIENRANHYQQLKDEGLNNWELTQQISIHSANASYVLAQLLAEQGGIIHLLPQIGSPFSLSYGGKQIGDSNIAWSRVANDTAKILEKVASSAGLEAGFQRREQNWEFSLQQANNELKEIEKQLLVAEIRKDIALHSRSIHEKSVEQLEEIADFYQEKFPDLVLYAWLSTTLQRLYREAYQSAYSMARLAEQAFRFERGADTTPLLEGNYWEASKAGLLAGERLMIDLRHMEKRYMETNYRSMEIDQAFSLTQINPAVLIQLKETGECKFSIPEFYFDLFYPGQYRRRIKSARLTIPCITGPYANVSATLTLEGSKIRNEAKLEKELLEVPPTRTVTIATSTAQNDSGVFQLDFRDERYMPFEGAGAISTWQLTLPKNFRPFDYSTINDVIMHISYTAEFDQPLREKVEADNGHLETTLASDKFKMSRLFSFRQEFSQAFHQLLHSPVNKPVPFELADKHFPIFLQGKGLAVSSASLILGINSDAFRDESDGLPSSFTMSLKIIGGKITSPLESFSSDAGIGSLPAASLRISHFDKFNPTQEPRAFSIEVKNPGDFKPDSSDPSVLDENKLKDLYLYLEYSI